MADRTQYLSRSLSPKQKQWLTGSWQKGERDNKRANALFAGSALVGAGTVLAHRARKIGVKGAIGGVALSGAIGGASVLQRHWQTGLKGKKFARGLEKQGIYWDSPSQKFKPA